MTNVVRPEDLGPGVGRRSPDFNWKERRALDELSRTYAMLRAGARLVRVKPDAWEGNCQACGLYRPLCWCHILTRGAWGVRWDLDNSWAWCSGCHRRLDQHWDEKWDWIVRRIGDDRWQLLRTRKRPGRRLDLVGMRLLLEREVERVRAAA